MTNEYILENKTKIFQYITFGTPLEDLELRKIVDNILTLIIYKEYVGKEKLNDYKFATQYLNDIQKLDVPQTQEDLITFWRQQGGNFTGLEIQRLENKIDALYNNDIELDMSVITDNILTGSRLKTLVFADNLMRNVVFLKSLTDNIKSVFNEENPSIDDIIYRVKSSNLIEFYYKGQLFYTKLGEL